MTKRKRFVNSLPLGILAWASCTVVGCGNYDAAILTTSYGIPHIVAEDYRELGFGQGYVVAQNHICILAEQIVKVRSERSLYFGPGAQNRHVLSDLGYKVLQVREQAVHGLTAIDSRTREMVEGYAAGYNRTLLDTDPGELPFECRGQPWVREIDSVDLFSYVISLALVSSGEAFIPPLVMAQPPTESGANSLSDQVPLPNFAAPEEIGSNGWAVGGDRTANGRGALLANPHFPAYGPLQFFESHLTIPHELNAYGAGLLGAPGIQIGFNRHLAWTHTVSVSTHFNLYQLQLVDGQPTQYLYDGEVRDMTAETHSVEINIGGGNTVVQSLTTYRTHLGPVLVIPGFLDWTHTTAFAFADANHNNIHMLDHWLSMARATSLNEFQQSFADYRGTPWVNTIAADASGNAFFVEGTPVPHFAPEVLAAFRNNPAAWGLFRQTGLAIFDGRTSATAWVDNSPVPYALAPKLVRNDFVANHNDSHWLTNPQQPLEGYSFFYGAERTAQRLRTRLGLTMLQEGGGSDGMFTAEELSATLLNNRQYLGELIRDDLVTRCRSVDAVPLYDFGIVVPLADTCDALEAWDGTMNADSAGAHLFQEFAMVAINSRLPLFEIPFSWQQPVATPSQLRSDPASTAAILQALALVTHAINQSPFSLTSPLGEVQFVAVGDERLPWGGGRDIAGTFNASGYSSYFRGRSLLPFRERGPLLNPYGDLTAEGLLVNRGLSFAFAVEYTDEGPSAHGLLSYSQSSDADSPHFADQTFRYSELGAASFRPILFSAREMLADDALTIRLIQDGAVIPIDISGSGHYGRRIAEERLHGIFR